MSPAATKSKSDKISKSYIVTPPHPKGHVISVKREILRWICSLSLVTVAVLLLLHNVTLSNISVYMMTYTKNFDQLHCIQAMSSQESLICQANPKTNTLKSKDTFYLLAVGGTSTGDAFALTANCLFRSPESIPLGMGRCTFCRCPKKQSITTTDIPWELKHVLLCLPVHCINLRPRWSFSLAVRSRLMFHGNVLLCLPVHCINLRPRWSFSSAVRSRPPNVLNFAFNILKTSLHCNSLWWGIGMENWNTY